MNVLSLFDGMSCGQIALNRAGIKYDNYFASEIDKYAIKVTQKNYPNTTQIGNIISIKGNSLPKIDLLIGGSPCQGFSFAGKQLNFNDPRSKLFFEFVRLLEEINPKYFLLENVKMKKEYQNVISKYLSVEPIEINSDLVSAQNRKRLYWTNILNIKKPEDKGLILKDILINNFSGKYLSEEYIAEMLTMKYKQSNRITDINKKSFCLMAQGGGRVGLSCNIINDGSGFRRLIPLECERLQTVPDNYTLGVSNTQRHKMLGNGWTVDVIAHILSQMTLKG